MPPKKKPAPAFSSFQILGKRAQELIRQARTRAKEELQTAQDAPAAAEKSPDQDLRVTFSAGNVAVATVTVLAVLIGAWLLYTLEDVIILLLLGFFMAAIVDPGVAAMEKRGVPRGIGVLLHYLLAVVLIVFLLVSLIPIIAEQLQQIAVQLSAVVNAFLANPEISLPLLPPELNARLTELAKAGMESLSIDQFAQTLQQFGENLASFAGGSFLILTRIGLSVVGFVVQAIIVLVLAFFVQVEKEKIRAWIGGFFPARHRHYLDIKTDAIHSKIGKWARGQLMLGLAVGTLTFFALIILRTPYATTLAVLAGFTEFIPYVGPFIAAVPAILIAFTQDGIVWALIVAGVYYAIQWCENNLLVPLIMKRAVGLSPIAIICAMLIGVSLPTLIHPILGIFLAVPVTTIISLFLEDLRTARRNRALAPDEEKH